jgi:hypothetical protein
VVLVLAARPRDESVETDALSGRTSHKEGIHLYLREGQVSSVVTRAWVWCGHDDEWYWWVWTPTRSTLGARFSRHGRRFLVSGRKSTIPRFSSSVRLELRGRLSEDGRSARGTLDAWVRDRGRRPPCTARARFRLTR